MVPVPPVSGVVAFVALFSAILTALHENRSRLDAIRFFGVCFVGMLALILFAGLMGSALHDFMLSKQ